VLPSAGTDGSICTAAQKSHMPRRQVEDAVPSLVQKSQMPRKKKGGAVPFWQT